MGLLVNGDENGQKWRRCNHVFGLPFLRWILNLNNDSSLNEKQLESLDKLDQLVKNNSSSLALADSLIIFRDLIQTDEDKPRSTLVNELRTNCGGALISIPKGLLTEVKKVASIAADVAPLSLLKKTSPLLNIEDHESWQSLGGYGFLSDMCAIHTGVGSDALNFNKDPKLAKLLKVANKGNQPSAIILRNRVGHEWGSSLIGLGDIHLRVLKQGLRGFTKQRTKTTESFVVACIDAFYNFKQIIPTGTLDRKLVIEFLGCDLDARSSGSIDRKQWKFIPVAAKNMRVGPSMKIEINEPVEYSFGPYNNPNDPFSEHQPKTENIRLSSFELIRVAFLLLETPKKLQYAGEFLSYTPFVDRYAGGNSKNNRVPEWDKETITVNDCKQALQIIRGIKKYEAKGRLSLPIRRHLMASEREYLTDSLVDAVITLEALFSTGDKDQLRLRIGASVAFLLAPKNTNQRKSIFKKTKSLYDTRSKIVHGGDPKKEDVIMANNNALELSRLCLRELLIGSATDLALDTQRANTLVIAGHF